MARPPGAAPAHLTSPRPGPDPARRRPGGTGARVLPPWPPAATRPGWLGYDRAYTQASRTVPPAARRWATSPVMDYESGQLGIQANTSEAILIEAPLPPVLPRPLIATTRLATTRSPTASTTNKSPPAAPTRSSTRRPRRRRRPAPVLSRRRSAGRRSICPLRPCRFHHATGAPRYSSHHPDRRRSAPGRDHDRRDTVPLPPGPPYASLAWHNTYAAPRNTIEGLNGYVEDPADQALAQPARRRSAASPPSPSSPRCSRRPRTSARSAPGAP